MEDMCYERRAEDCVDESAHHALANAGGRECLVLRDSVFREKEGGDDHDVFVRCFRFTGV